MLIGIIAVVAFACATHFENKQQQASVSTSVPLHKIASTSAPKPTTKPEVSSDDSSSSSDSDSSPSSSKDDHPLNPSQNPNEAIYHQEAEPATAPQQQVFQ